jgi:hypothetical protein
MQGDRVTWKGVLARFLTSLVLVYGTFNPEGFSFFHWAIAPLARGQLDSARELLPAKLLVGLLLIGVWAFFLRSTQRSIGIKGALLILAIAATLVWALVDWNVMSPTSSRAIGHLVLIALALTLALGMSWSHISRRVTGQVDTDEDA